MTRWQKKIETENLRAALAKSKMPDYKTIRDAFIARGMRFDRAYNAAIRYFKIFCTNH